MVPKKLFFTKGVGKHKERLTSFELALRDAGIASQNLVRVSSIFPPRCKVITRKEGHRVIDTGPYAVVRHPSYVGGILFCVGTALCLGSVWALVPAAVASALMRGMATLPTRPLSTVAPSCERAGSMSRNSRHPAR